MLFPQRGLKWNPAWKPLQFIKLGEPMAARR
jgi:phosphatidylserine decarboxylase